MRLFIISGTPGCGKTAILRALEMQGHFVVFEAATDVIAYEQSRGNVAPWVQPIFIDNVVKLQKQRQVQASNAIVPLQFFDRSPICTYALALYLGFEPSAALLQEIERIKHDYTYEKKRVFFIENLGFCNPSDARKISFEESLVFEKIHLEAYEKFGYECVLIPRGTVEERAAKLLSYI